MVCLYGHFLFSIYWDGFLFPGFFGTVINYEDFFLHFKQHNADMSVAAVPYVVKVPYGVFNLEGREIKGVTEKPTISYYANAGIYLIKKERLDLIPENEFFNATDFMDKLITNGFKVIRYPISGYWIDIGQFDELERARERAAKQSSPYTISRAVCICETAPSVPTAGG